MERPVNGLMAKAGRPPKSTEQHRRDDTLRADRHAGTPLVVGGRGEKPTPPSWLAPEGKRIFTELVDGLWESNLIDQIDGVKIALAANELQLVAQVSRKIRSEGLRRKTKRGGYNGSRERVVSEVNDLISERGRAVERANKLLGELGIGPMDRARLANMGVGGKSPEDEVPGLSEVTGGKVVPMDGKGKARAG